MSIPRKILYIHPSNELYGADRSLLRLVTTLDPTQFQPVVAVANDIAYEEGLLTAELAKVRIPSQKLKLGVLRRRYFTPLGMVQFSYQTLQTAVSLATFCRRQQISLIHSNSSAVISGGLAAKLARIPHVWHIREIIEQPPLLNRFIATNLALFATKVIAVSTPTKDNLLESRPSLQNKIHVIHNGIDIEKFSHVSPTARQTIRTSWDIPSDKLVIGMVGRISSWKGQTFLLNAMQIVIQTNPNAHLVFVGGNVPGEEWRLQELQQKIVDMNLAQQVHLQPFSLGIPQILAGFDIFALPSTKPDPFPTVILEAMAAGKPIVATAHGGPIEQIEHGVSGLLVSPTNPQEMANALQHLLTDTHARQNMGQAAQKRAQQYFTTERYAANIVQLYQQII